MKIKSRKEREIEYCSKYGDVNLDVYARLSDVLGDKFNEDLLLSCKDRIEEARENISYNTISLTFYEEPIQSHRPRVNYSTRGFHVPNAKENKTAVGRFLERLKTDISVVSTPMKLSLTAYLPMPPSVNPVEMVLYETKHDRAISKPDADNIIKAYLDMIQENIILDDDLVSSIEFNKYYSLKPRVELEIIYPDGYASESAYKKIVSRKRFKELDNVSIELKVTPIKKKKKGKSK